MKSKRAERISLVDHDGDDDTKSIFLNATAAKRIGLALLHAAATSGEAIEIHVSRRARGSDAVKIEFAPPWMYG